MKKFIIILCSMTFINTGCMSVSSNTNTANFNTISHDGWNFKMDPSWGLNDHNHQVVSSDDGHPVRYGKFSERFEVRPGDCGITGASNSDCERDKERSEMSGIKDKWFSGEYWYRWSLFIPKGHKNLWKTKTSYAQFKPVGCGPIFQLLETKMKSNKGELMVHFPYTEKFYSSADNWIRPYYVLTADYINKWMDFVVYAKWETKIRS